jgi:hypothetical protein
MREEDLSDRLGELMKGIHVPGAIAEKIVDSLQADAKRSDAERLEQISGLRQQLATIRTRMDQIYEDKLDGKIDDELWTRNQAKCREQERTLEATLSSLDVTVTRVGVLTVERFFELANKTDSLYVTRNSAERGELLKSVLLNCATDGVSLWPAYRRPSI